EIEQDPTLSMFYRPFANHAGDDAEVEAAAARAREAIAGGVVPALRRLAAFLEDEYIPACRDSIAISEGVDGIEAYEYALSSNTTLSLTADEVHEIGLREVARIRREMLRTIARSDFMDGRSESGLS